MPRPTLRLPVLLCLVVLLAVVPTAQGPAGVTNPPGLAVHATTPNELRAWDSTVDRMVRGRELVDRGFPSRP